MTREGIIRMAREAELIMETDCTTPWIESHDLTPYLERFAALVAAASEEQWKQAVISELVCCHIYNAAHENDPRKALHDAISWNVQVALDPQVSSDAQALIDRGVAAEREACAKVCEELVPNSSRQSYAAGVWDVATFDCAAAIRARGQHENS